MLQHELDHVFLLPLVSDRHFGLPTEALVVLESSQGVLGTFLLPLRAHGSGQAWPVLPCAAKAEAWIVG